MALRHHFVIKISPNPFRLSVAVLLQALLHGWGFLEAGFSALALELGHVGIAARSGFGPTGDIWRARRRWSM